MNYKKTIIFLILIYISIQQTPEDIQKLNTPEDFVGGFFKFNSYPQGFYEVNIWDEPKTQSQYQNILQAFSDYDGDSYTDYYTLDKDGPKCQIYLYQWDQDDYKFKASQICDYADGCGIYMENIYPIDINYDGKLDLIMLFQTYEDGNKTGKQLFPQIKGTQHSNEVKIQEELIQLRISDDSQPFMANLFNQDNKMRKMQIVYEPFKDDKNQQTQIISLETSKSQVIISQQLNFVDIQQKCSNKVKTMRKFTVPHFNGMADIDGDCMADIVLTTQDEKGDIYLEIWIRQEKSDSYCKEKEYKILDHESDNMIFKSMVYADFNFDGSVDFVLMYSDTKDDSIIIKYLPNQYKASSSNLCKAQDWGFKNPDSMKGQKFSGFKLPQFKDEQFQDNISNILRFGDINLDGYNDLLIVLQKSDQEDEEAQTLPYVLINEGSSSKEKEDQTKFKIQDNDSDKYSITKILQKHKNYNYLQASFFDLNENGILDIYLNYYDKTDDSKKIRMSAIYNYQRNENNFIKTMGVNGVCSSKRCAAGIYYGSTFMCKVQKSNNDYNVAKAVQLSQSAYSPLQLPYSIIGLGRTNNYIEDLTAGYSQTESPQYKSWETIIPNSQLIIFPYTEDTEKWDITIYIQPTKATIVVIIVTSCLLLLLGFSIIYCHMKEKEEDKKTQPFPIIR